MEGLAEKLTNFILRKGIIEESDYEIYKYGFQSGMEVIACCIMSVLIAMYFGSIFKLLVLIGVFFPLRAYSGGVHMKHFYACFICSALVIIGAFLVTDEKWIADIRLIFLEGAVLLLIHFLAYAAIQCDQKEKKFFSKMRKRIIVVILLVSVLFYVLNENEWLQVVLYAVGVVLVSEVIQIVKICVRNLLYY